MKQKKYIVWDWNGTLFDDIDICIDTLNSLLSKYHLAEVDKVAYRDVFRFPIIDYYQAVGFDFDKTPFDVLAKQYMDSYIPKSMNCHLFLDVKRSLEAFHNIGLKQFIISASLLEHLHQQLAQYDILPYFDGILGLDNIHANSKIAIAKKWIEDNRINPDEVLFVGDSVHDSEVAAFCGCECVLISRGHQSKTILEKTGCRVKESIGQLWDEEFA